MSREQTNLAVQNRSVEVPAAGIEPLESRRLFASIAGTVYLDLDRSTALTAGIDRPLEGWSVTVHDNQDGSNQTVFTDKDGHYTATVSSTHSCGFTATLGAQVGFIDDAPSTGAYSIAATGATYDFGVTTAPPPDTGFDLSANSGDRDHVACGTSAVRYGDGLAVESATDLTSAGFGLPFSHTRTWSSSADYSLAGQNGNGWVSGELPSLAQGASGSVAAISSATEAQWFDSNGVGGFNARHASHDKLTYGVADDGSGANEYVLTLGDTGSQIRYYAFDPALPLWQQGAFKSMRDALGHEIKVYSHDTAGRITELRRSAAVGAVTTIQSWKYDYLTTGVNAGKLSTLTLRTSTDGGTTFVTVRKTDYTYYDGSATGEYSFGAVGDLRTAIIRDPSGNAIDTWYYRYYRAGESGGFAGGLKYVLDTEAYARLAAGLPTGTTPLTATNAAIAPYAVRAYTYDSSRRVTREVVGGAGSDQGSGDGRGTFGYAYCQSSNSNGYNAWKTRTTETEPDGTINLVYTDYLDQTMLAVHENAAATLQSPTYYHYDAHLHQDLIAHPSAFAPDGGGHLFSESFIDLVHLQTGANYQYLQDHAGLIEAYTYATSSTGGSSSPGNAAGELSTASLMHGDQDSGPVLQESLQYFIVQYNPTATGTVGAEVHPVAAKTVYANDDGTGGQTTNYAYTWQLDANSISTTLPLSMQVKLPAVLASHNGPGGSTQDTTSTFYDPYGDPAWVKDGGGFIAYAQWDPITGAKVKSIDDVNTADTSDFANLPAAWCTASGGGKEQITLDGVDALGRTLSTQYPGGSTDYTVYLDSNHEVRKYIGWNTATHATTGPTQIWRTYMPIASAAAGQQTVYDETLTSSAAPSYDIGTNKPTGVESITSGDIQSLVRTLTDNAGQQVIEDDYFSMSGVTFTTATAALGSAGNDTGAGGNRHRTLTDFDAGGRVNRTTDPTGTIVRLTFNALGNVASRWAGTNDSGATDGNPAGSGANNMTEEQSFDYDNGAAADGTLTGIATYPGGAAATDQQVRVYDWRDRLIGFTPPPAVSATQPSTQPSTQPTTPPAPQAATQPTTRPTTQPATRPTTLPTRIDPYPAEAPRLDGTPPADAQPGSRQNQFDDRGRMIGGRPGPGVRPPAQVPTIPPPAVNHYDSKGRLIDAPSSRPTTPVSSAVGTPTGNGQVANSDYTLIQWTNLDGVLGLYGFSTVGVSLSDFAGGIASVPSGTLQKLRSETTTAYDDQGRPYQSNTFSVDPSNGAVSANALVTGIWYDRRGNVIKASEPGGAVTKSAYDGVGQLTTQYTTNGGGDGATGLSCTWSDAGGLTGDNVLEQADYLYDADGNLLLTTLRQHNHDDTNTGALGNASTNPKARVSYIANYFDAADRLTDSVDVGTNGGSAYTRPGSPAARSNTALVTSYGYDAAGNVKDVTDPKGIVTRTLYDLIGRTTSTDAAYVDGTPSTTDDQITRYTYDGDDHTLTMTADLPSGSHDQVTKYVYGVTVSGGSTINSDDLLKEVDYPNKSTGAAGTAASDKDQDTYDAAGEVLTYTDQNGTLHAYTYDVLGRQTADAVTVASGNPKNVDTSILRHETAYNTQGLPYLYTSYNAASGGTVVNQVQDVFNGLGQLTTEYQAVSGSVNTSTSPKVQYAYVEMAGGANNSRLTSMTYPNGRVLHYVYNTGLDDSISRLSYIADDNGSGGIGTHLEEYSYLGLDTIFREAHPENGTELTYIKQSGESNGDGGDQYTGLDRFGRVVDQRYLVTSTGTATDRFQYGYDRDSNPLYKNNLLNSPSSELYHASSTASGDDATGYDLLGRLTGFSRGTLSSSGHNGTGLDTVSAASDTQSWNLDAIGNQTSVVTNGSTVTNLHNDGNELTSNNGNSLAFDSNGNTTTDESGKTYTYDAWNNQIVAKTSGGTTLETYAYDALGRRIVEGTSSGTTYLYYDSDLQVLQEQGSSVSMTQYVWSASFVDDLVLRDRDADNNSGTGSLGKSGSGLEQRLYVEHDANHNATSLLTTSATVQERFIYLPYGKASVLNGTTWASTTDTLNWTYRFQGGRWDAVIDKVYFRNRIYDANTGIWTTSNPTRYAGDTNFYLARQDSPTIENDAYGVS